MTASEMFYLAGGGTPHEGEHRCYYCGAKCDDSHTTKFHVQSTFTNRDVIMFPGSAYVCSGCVEASGNGADEMVMLDGTIKVRENQRGMQPRMYSWVITPTKRYAATKAHIAELRSFIMDPLPPPFVVVLADSGQKQLLFRAPVAYDRDRYPLMLEDQVIEVNRKELGDALIAADSLAAAIGKPGLLSPDSASLWITCEAHYGNTDPMEAWAEWKHTPQGKLAAWLAKSKGKKDGN